MRRTSSVPRAALVPAVLLTAALVIAACSGSDSANKAGDTKAPGTVAQGAADAQSALPPGSPLQDPPALQSKDGVLEATLTVTRTSYNVAGQTVQGLTYNGLVQPPTLKVNPGDTIKLSLVNDLPSPPQDAKESGTTITPAQARSSLTNLHYHGFDVSPSGDSDNVFLQVKRGETQKYTVVLPSDHEQGMFWYHPHIHLNSESQVLGGMSGLIQVGSPSSQLPKDFDGIKTRYFALKDLPSLPQPVAPPGSANLGPIQFDGQRLVNGQVTPTVDIAPGEVQLWRFANIGANVPYAVTLGSATFFIINQDGAPQPAMTPSTKLLLPPGKRFDVLIMGPPAGSIDMMTETVPFGSATVPAYKLATVTSAGTPVKGPALPSPLLNGKGPITAAATVQRTFALGFDESTGQYTINGKPFSMDRIDTTVTGGDTEEWTITNTTPIGHPFHIHITDFQVLSITGAPQAFTGQMDTVLVPPNGNVVFKITFDPRYPGKFVYHCHILNHEDGGMMGTIEVVAPKSTGTTTPGSAVGTSAPTSTAASSSSTATVAPSTTAAASSSTSATTTSGVSTTTGPSSTTTTAPTTTKP